MPCIVIEDDSTMQSVLDFHYSWRWLLPSGSGQQAVYFGLNHEEQRWWTQTLAMQSPIGTSSPTEGCLIAFDHCDVESVVEKVNDMRPSWLCAWGSGSAVNRLRDSLGEFGSIREYALLPAYNPRVVVPLISSKHAIAGLHLHRPGRWVAQVGLLVARSLAKFRHFGLVRRRVLLVATRSPYFPIGAVHAKLKISLQTEQQDYALYLGAQGSNRKTVVLPIKKNSQPKVILKIAETTKARSALINEAQALQTLATITSLASRVPKLIGIEETDSSLTLLQEYRTRLFARKHRFNAAVVDFLVDLAKLERKMDKLAEVVPVLPQHVDAGLIPRVRIAATQLREKLEILANNGVRSWMHRCHGDFAPWNCSWTSRGLFVFDWEESKAHELALGDAFYFVISPFVHVQKQSGAAFVMAIAIQFADELARRAGFDEIDVRMYLAVWLLQRLSKNPFYGELVIELERSWQ